MALSHLELAEKYLVKALEFDDNNAGIHNNLANLYQKKEYVEKAEEHYKKSLTINPNYVDAHYNLANLFFAQKQLDKAKKHYETLIKIDPNHVDAHYNLANLFRTQKQYDHAEKCYYKTIEINPNYAKSYNDLANLFAEKKQTDKAQLYYQKALKIDPNYAEVYNNLASILKEKRQFDQAESYYHCALKINPNYAEVHNNLASTLKEKKQFYQAEQHYQFALKLNPNYATPYYNLANFAKEQKQFEKAKKYYQQALVLNEHFVDAKFNLAMLYLATFNFTDAWVNYEYRYHSDKKEEQAILPNSSTPHYQSDKLIIKGKHLLICPEQGIGDEVMFASVLHELASQVAQNPDTKITLACEPRLVALFQHSFDFLTVIPKDPANQYKSLEGVADYWLFIGSLPKYYRNELSDFDKHQPYLKANSDLVNRWQTRLSQLTHKVNVGISWAGGAKAEHKRDRSLTLEQLTPILEKIGQQANIINLQYGDHTEAIEQFSTQTGITIHDWEDADPLKDLDNFAAQISALDLVISIDNSTVHFAGALGVKTLVMLPFNQDWRWGEDRDDSYWYPNIMRLFRQPTDGDWDSVVESLVEHLSINFVCS